MKLSPFFLPLAFCTFLFACQKDVPQKNRIYNSHVTQLLFAPDTMWHVKNDVDSVYSLLTHQSFSTSANFYEFFPYIDQGQKGICELTDEGAKTIFVEDFAFCDYYPDSLSTMKIPSVVYKHPDSTFWQGRTCYGKEILSNKDKALFPPKKIRFGIGVEFEKITVYLPNERQVLAVFVGYIVPEIDFILPCQDKDTLKDIQIFAVIPNNGKNEIFKTLVCRNGEPDQKYRSFKLVKFMSGEWVGLNQKNRKWEKIF